MSYVIESYTEEKNGKKYEVEISYDDCMREPWKECDGHGIVSDWENRDKRPSERILNEDRYSKRFYDFSESVRIAKRDNWGLSDENLSKLETKLGRKATKAEIATQAVENDFAYLKAWCDDEWHYAIITVTLLHEDAMPSAKYECLGGVEYGEYFDEYPHHTEYIKEIVDELISQIEAQ